MLLVCNLRNSTNTLIRSLGVNDETWRILKYSKAIILKNTKGGGRKSEKDKEI